MDKELNQFWRFENQVVNNNNEATLYVYGDIVTYDFGEYNFPDDVVPNKFKNELNELGDVDTIHVRINSSGGSVFAAYAIMNLLKNHKAKIITYNDGIAASAATIIAMAGDRIVSALGSMWMVHLPSIYVSDSVNINDLKKLYEMLNSIGSSIVEIYHSRTGIEKAELEKMLSEDTWMTGTQALEKGFVDEVTDLEVVAYLNEDKQTAFFNGLNINLEKVCNKDILVSMLKPAPKPQENISNKSEQTTKNTGGKIMNLEYLKAKHADIYNDAINEGIQNERKRIREIDDMSLPGMEELMNKAKFETGITAAELAVELIKAQKQKGINFLKDAQIDAKHLGEVPSGGNPQNSNEQEEEALLAHLAQTAKKAK